MERKKYTKVDRMIDLVSRDATGMNFVCQETTYKMSCLNFFY